MGHNELGTSDRARFSALRLPGGRSVLAGLVATVGIAAIGENAVRGAITSVEPRITWGAQQDKRIDGGARTVRTGPHWENWGNFDWMHEYHSYEIKHFAPVQYNFELPGGGAHLRVDGQQFLLSKQAYETDIAWKEVGLLFGGIAIQERGERSYPVGAEVSYGAEAVARRYWRSALSEPVGTLISEAKRMTGQSGHNIDQLELQVSNGTLTRAIAKSGKTELNLLAPANESAPLSKNAAVRAVLAKSRQYSWNAALTY